MWAGGLAGGGRAWLQFFSGLWFCRPLPAAFPNEAIGLCLKLPPDSGLFHIFRVRFIRTASEYMILNKCPNGVILPSSIATITLIVLQSAAVA